MIIHDVPVFVIQTAFQTLKNNSILTFQSRSLELHGVLFSLLVGALSPFNELHGDNLQIALHVRT